MKMAPSISPPLKIEERKLPPNIPRPEGIPPNIQLNIAVERRYVTGICQVMIFLASS